MWAILTREYFGGEDLKIGVSRILGVLGDYRELWDMWAVLSREGAVLW
jgi:hypothetical protein